MASPLSRAARRPLAAALAVLATAAALAAPPAADAATLVFAGRLDDPGNAALRAADLGAASFASPEDIADNVALYGFTLDVGGAVVVSTADGPAGVDPYLTLFSGLGGAATFVASNYAQAFGAGGDVVLPLNLAAGSYTLALGAFANMSFAENLGTGTLADGFIRLGETYSVRDASYRVTVLTPVPEPASAALLAAGLLACGAACRRRSRH